MKPQDHYTALVESTDDAIIAKNLAGTVVSWNPAAERLFGYRAEEMIGSSIRRLIPDDRQDEEDKILAKIAAGERVGQFITQRLHKHGHTLRLFVTVSPVKDGEGKIVGASKIARDASELLEAQRQMQESQERFRLLADNISQFAWIARPDGHIFWYNRRWFDYTGTTLEEMEGWGWTKVHHPQHVDRVVSRIQHSWDTGEEWEDTFPLRGADGSYRWFLSRAVPIRDSEGRITQWFGTNTDITEQREQAEKVNLLLREISHRSKNLLATVQVLARRTAEGDPGFVDRFEQRIAGLAANQDLLLKGNWDRVDLAGLVPKQLRFLGELNSQVEISGPDCALAPRAAEAIGMALHELATNSLKYGALSADGGRVAIAWETRPDKAGLKIDWREEGGPAVSPPARTGFGTTLIRDVPIRMLQAQVNLDYRPEGVCWSLEGADLLAVGEAKEEGRDAMPTGIVP